MNQDQIKLILKQSKEFEKIKQEYDKDGLIILRELIDIYLDETNKEVQKANLLNKGDNCDWDWKPVDNGNKVPTYQLVPKIKENYVSTDKPLSQTYKNGKPKSQSKYMIKKYGRQLSAYENADGSVKSLD